MRLNNLLFLFLFFAVVGSTSAQPGPPSYEIGFSSIASKNGQTPFWLFANQQGKFFPSGNTAAMDLKLFAAQKTDRAVDYEYGLELYGRLGESDDFWMHQGYVGLTFYDLVHVRGGRWREVMGSRLPDISSGSTIWSGNARPMPKVELGTPGYIEVPYTDGWVELKGLISHGWFDDDRYASDVWLHHKNAFIRLGGSFPVNVYYGLNHYAQWGGSSPLQEEPYPADFESYLRVLFIRSASPSHPGSPDGWIKNKIGNHLAARNHGIDVDFSAFSAGVFLQDIIEDGSGWRRQNFPDGLWGLWLHFREEEKLVQAVTYEYLQTTDQSGRYHDIDGEILGGNDNYFNHGHYQSGWSYHGFTLGTPMITSPILNDPENHRFENTRVRAHHLGVKGHLFRDIRYRGLLTYSRNYGTHSNPYESPKDQLSGLLEITTPLDFFGLTAGVTLAADKGDMYGNNLGVMLRLSHSGPVF